MNDKINQFDDIVQNDENDPDYVEINTSSSKYTIFIEDIEIIEQAISAQG